MFHTTYHNPSCNSIVPVVNVTNCLSLLEPRRWSWIKTNFHIWYNSYGSLFVLPFANVDQIEWHLRLEVKNWMNCCILKCNEPLIRIKHGAKSSVLTTNVTWKAGFISSTVLARKYPLLYSWPLWILSKCEQWIVVWADLQTTFHGPNVPS